MSDLRLAIRMLGRQPGVSFLAIVALALGIGLTTTMFSILNGVVLRGLPFEDGDRIYQLTRVNLREQADPESAATLHDFEAWRARQRSFEDLAAVHTGTANVVAAGGVPERYRGAWMSVNTLQLLRVQPAIGRDFSEADARPGAERVVIIGDRVWRERFGADPAAVGQTLRVNGTSMTVVGVMPPKFGFPGTQELWVALHQAPLEGPRAGSTRVSVIGRLGTDASFDQAAAEMATIGRQLEQEAPEAQSGFGVTVRGYVEQFLGRETIGALNAMLVAVLCVLVIACANVANLVLARAAQRGKEIAVRTAIGASRFRVVRQLLTEVLVLAGMGASAGLALAWAGVTMFNRAIVDTSPPFFIDIRIDAAVLLFVVGTTVLAAIVSGMLPAMRASRADVRTALGDEGRGASSLRLGRFSKGLVIAEIALSFALLVASGLVIQSIVNSARADFGFAMADVWTGRVVLPQEEYPDPGSRRRFAENLLPKVRALPGVVNAALTVAVPPNAVQASFRMPGQVYENDRGYPQTRHISVSPEFFDVMRVGMLQGRGFTATDRDGAERVAIVNVSFARSFFPEGAIGRQVALARGTDTGWRTIVGIVPDMGMAEVDEGEVPEGLYYPLAQSPSSSIAVVAHVAGPPLELTSAVRDVVRAIDPNLPVFNVMTVAEFVKEQTWGIAVFGSLFMAFGFAALFLATVGLYGVMAFSVSRRTQEIGIRMAVGATSRDVLRQVLGQGLGQVAAGLFLGTGLAALLAGAMPLLLLGVSRYDPLTFIVVAAVLACTGLLACLVPARRAARVDPMDALRWT